MKRVALLLTTVAICLSPARAQQTSSSHIATVPRFVRFAGLIKDGAGQPLAGTVGVSFALYRDQEGGAPLEGCFISDPLTPTAQATVVLRLTKRQNFSQPRQL